MSHFQTIFRTGSRFCCFTIVYCFDFQGVSGCKMSSRNLIVCPMNKGLQSNFLNDCFVIVGLVWGILCRCRSLISETITFLRFGWISNQWSEGCLYKIIFKTQHKSRRKGLSSNGMFVTMGSSLSAKSVSFGKTNVCENVLVFSLTVFYIEFGMISQHQTGMILLV